MRLKYPANINIIRVPCTGKVDVIHLLRAFQKGADGVYVVGCLEGACHYNEGNFRARERVAVRLDVREDRRARRKAQGEDHDGEKCERRTPGELP